VLLVLLVLLHVLVQLQLPAMSPSASSRSWISNVSLSRALNSSRSNASFICHPSLRWFEVGRWLGAATAAATRAAATAAAGTGAARRARAGAGRTAAAARAAGRAGEVLGDLGEVVDLERLGLQRLQLVAQQGSLHLCLLSLLEGSAARLAGYELELLPVLLVLVLQPHVLLVLVLLLVVLLVLVLLVEVVAAMFSPTSVRSSTSNVSVSSRSNSLRKVRKSAIVEFTSFPDRSVRGRVPPTGVSRVRAFPGGQAGFVPS
jgi:hypothetical protein